MASHPLVFSMVTRTPTAQLSAVLLWLENIFLGLGVLILGLPYHFGKQSLGTLQRPEVRLAGCYVMDSFVHLFGQHHVLIQ